MSSRRLFLALTAGLVTCADLERGGDPLPAAPREAGAPEADGGDGAGAVRSYARDVHPLLVDLCGRCHSSNGQASNTALVLGSDAARDLPQVQRLINPDNPAGSRLLVKGAGSGHGGGTILAAGTPEHLTILEWIRQGSAP